MAYGQGYKETMKATARLPDIKWSFCNQNLAVEISTLSVQYRKIRMGLGMMAYSVHSNLGTYHSGHTFFWV